MKRYVNFTNFYNLRRKYLQVRSVGDEVYSLEWWKSDSVSFRKSVSYVIQIAQNSRTLSLGGIANLDLVTFTSVS